MKSSRSYSLLVLLALTACAHQEMDIATNELFIPKEVYAELEQASSNDTRVYADAKLRVLWNYDDRITMFSKYSYGYQYRFLGRTGATAGKFDLIKEDGSYITGNELPYIYAVYPYQELTEIDNDGIITIDLPAEQTYAANSFGLGANTMVSISENNEMRFKNVCGYFGLQLNGDNVSVSSITLKGKNGEPLAGTAKITPVLGSTPTMKFDSNYPTTETLTLNCPTPVQIGTTADESTIFWIVVPPTVFSQGLTITITDENGRVFEKTTTKKNEIKRNTLLRMPAIKVEFEESGASDDPIVFADENVKTKLVAAFDTNSDGELSYSEAAKVTSLDGVFGTTKTYSSFDEFQYFIGVTSIPAELFQGWQLTSIIIPNSVTSIGRSVFKDCLKLESVSIPSSIKTIPSEMFQNCSNLESVIIPERVTKIGDHAFYGCSSLINVNIPNTVSIIESSLFGGCSSLASIIIPESVESIGSSAFWHCSSLKSINIPDSVTNIGMDAFMGCSSLTSFIIPSGIYKLEQGVFSSCSSLTSITIPESITIIGPLAFSHCTGLSSVEIPESVTVIGSSAFWDCNSLLSITVLSQTPPSGGSDMFLTTNSCPIYVPAKSFEAYKTAQYWSDYADRIQAIGTPQAIDLGLPSGLKWASFNLGATKPEEYGDYYAWGETEPYYSSLNPLTWKDGKEVGYDWTLYKWCNGSSSALTKYCSDSSYGNNGFTDTKTVLDPEDDAAHVNLGGKWRMPTDAEWTELRENCTWSLTIRSGSIQGRLVTGKNGNSIFLPDAGFRFNTILYDLGSCGYYWSSSLTTASPSNAWYVYCSSGNGSRYGTARYYGNSIRPVYAE